MILPQRYGRVADPAINPEINNRSQYLQTAIIRRNTPVSLILLLAAMLLSSGLRAGELRGTVIKEAKEVLVTTDPTDRVYHCRHDHRAYQAHYGDGTSTVRVMIAPVRHTSSSVFAPGLRPRV
jgi:hypothetical protein